MSQTIEQTLPPTIDVLAWGVRRERPDDAGDEKSDWYEAERLALVQARRRVAAIAYALWQSRGETPNRALEHWVEAERLVLWDNWVRAVLKPYIALESARSASIEAMKLEGLRPIQGIQAVGLFAVLDGSPEYSRHWQQVAEEESKATRPEHLVEMKDAAFYRHCTDLLTYLGGQIVEIPMTTAGSESAEKRRLYQDGCVASFAGTDALDLALNAGLRLRASLVNYNEACQLAWNERFHARIAIAHTWLSALSCVPYASRDGIVVAPEIFSASAQDRRLRGFLIASGVRLGPEEHSCH